jgi:nucleoside-diphosphate-sugar epimerase
VHAEDLAGACVAVLGNREAYAKTYTLSGGEILSYRELVERVFLGLNIRPRIVVVPVVVLRVLIRMIRLIPRFRYLTPEMASRMNADLCFDHTGAAADFGFSPRKRFVYTDP